MPDCFQCFFDSEFDRIIIGDIRLRISCTVFEFYAKPKTKFLKRYLGPIDPNAVTERAGLVGSKLLGGHGVAPVFEEYAPESVRVSRNQTVVTA